MHLDLNQIQKLVKERPHSNEIEDGVVMAARLRFHTDPIVNNFHHNHFDDDHKKDNSFTGHHHNSYLDHYLAWIYLTIEDREKQSRFLSYLHNGPYPTVELLEKLWNKRDRIFRAQDAFTRVEFTEDSLNDDSDEYLKEICFREFMENVVRNHEKTSPNSFVVIDLPRFERDLETGEPINLPEFPEPRPIMVDIRAVIDYDRDNKELTHCIYHAEPSFPQFPKGSIIAVDRFAYWVIPKDKDEIPVFDNGFSIPHNLGFVPAVQIGKKQLKKQDNLVMSNILVSSLGELDSLLLAQVSKKYLDGYMNPIIELLEEVCDYKDDNGDLCNNGEIQKFTGVHHTSGERQFRTAPCPTCKARGMIFPGSILTRSVRVDADPDQGALAAFITPDVDFLKYTREEINLKKDDIIGCTVGVMPEANDQAKNIPQVEAGTESRMDVLLSESENRASVKQEILKIIFTIRYRDMFIRVKVHGGTQFLLRTTQQIMESMKEAKEIGASQTELMEFKEQLIRTEFANDPQKQARQLLLLQLEPVPLSNLLEANNLLAKGLISKENFVIKANFDTFIRRFEREKVDLLEFLSLSSPAAKVTIVSKILQGYARDAIKDTEPVPEPTKDEREAIQL